MDDSRFMALENPTVRDIDWAVGLFEGEGSASFDRTERAVVYQKYRWICDKFYILFGGSVYKSKHKGDGNKRKPHISWQWQVTGPRARGFLMTIFTQMSPYRKWQIRRTLSRETK